MLALLVSALAGAAYVAVTDFQLQPYKPTWMLVREIGTGDDETLTAALAELDRRALAPQSRLPAALLMDAADLLLARQAHGRRGHR